MSSEAITEQPKNTEEHNTQVSQFGILSEVKELFIKQIIELESAIIRTKEVENVYRIYNNENDQLLFTAREKTPTTCCYSIGPNRGFTIQVIDNNNRPVIQFERESVCMCNCGDPCNRICIWNDKLKVYGLKTRPLRKYLIGSVKLNWSLTRPSFSVLDRDEELNYIIEGPRLPYGAPEFNILHPKTKAILGKIKKRWSGVTMEIGSDLDSFLIQFPPEEDDEEINATLLGALILIDFKFFEN